MKVLFNVNTFGMDPSMVLETVRVNLAEELKSTIEDSMVDGELHQFDDYRVRIDPESIIVGDMQRDELLEIIEKWNPYIQENLEKRINAISAAFAAGEMPSWDMKMDAIWALQMSADYFHVGRELGVYLPNEMGYEFWKHTIEAEELEDIRKNPESYAIAEVSFK